MIMSCEVSNGNTMRKCYLIGMEYEKGSGLTVVDGFNECVC